MWLDLAIKEQNLADATWLHRGPGSQEGRSKGLSGGDAAVAGKMQSWSAMGLRMQ